MYTLVTASRLGKDKLRLDKDKHTVKIKFIAQLANTAQRFKRSFVHGFDQSQTLRIDKAN
jgi:hypothetical protein